MVPDSTVARLRLRDVRKSFNGAEVVKGVDLSLYAGQLLAIIGPSGSGKSTLLRCCNRLEEPDSGQVLLDGIDITGRDVDVNRVRRQIGMVFQSFNLYPHLDAVNNIALALRKVDGLERKQAHDKALTALARVGLAHKAQAYPAQLSGGQQQRVAIARALVLEPAVLLFDEPTSALDPELVGEVLAVMRELRAAGATMLVVTHEMQFAREAADHVVFMDHGSVIEEGPPSALFDSPDHPRTRHFLSRVERVSA